MADPNQPPTSADYLVALERRFERHHQDPKVASGKPFLSGAQVVHRLNETLGLPNWTHSVLREGVWEDSDEIWVYGRLEGVLATGEPFAREDYGSKKITRSRQDRTPTQLGDDHQAAKTDSLKRCAKQLGVGAYLNDDIGAETIALGPAIGPAIDPDTGLPLVCVSPGCGKALEEVKFSNNATWSIAELAKRSKALTGGRGVLCRVHYFEVREEKQAQAAGATGLRRGAA